MVNVPDMVFVGVELPTDRLVVPEGKIDIGEVKYIAPVAKALGSLF